MKNILKVWTDFNKNQTQSFKGEAAHRWLKWAEDKSRLWGEDNYPKGEDWKYVNFGSLPTTNLKIPKETPKNLTEESDDYLIFEIKNFGSFDNNISTVNIEGLSIESELESIESDNFLSLSEDLNKKNPFSQVAQSFLGLGCTIRFSKEYQNKKPIKIIIQLNDFKENDLFIPYNLRIKSESSSSPHVFVELAGENFEGVSNFNCEVEVKEGANLFMAIVEKGGDQSRFVSNLTGSVGKNGALNVFDFTGPSFWSRHNSNVNLEEEGAFVNLSGIYLNHKENFIDHHTSIRHKKGFSDSKEDYRGILNDKARAVFNGKILIDAHAAKSNSDQINKNLLLSSKAEIDTKPELQIYNDDVKAAHGATIGQLDNEQKFYLQSRGYSEDEASQILARAFVYDLLEDQSKLIQKFVEKDLGSYLNLVRGSQK